MAQARGIGERLRNAREARGLSLDEIEAATRIRRRYLEALEAEAFDQLPGAAYAKGFLRSYAAYLGLPPEDLIGMYPEFLAGPIITQGSPVEVRITPATPQSRARRIITGIAVLIALGAVLMAYMLYGQLRQFAVTPPPTGTPPSARAPSATAVPPAQAPGAPSQSPAPPASPITPTAVATAAPPAKPAPVLPAPAAQPSGLTGPLSLVVVATDRSWVRTVADGVTVYEGFLNAGDRQTWQARHQLTLKIGNASAVEVSVNGQPLGRLGNPGDVVDKTFTAGPATP